MFVLSAEAKTSAGAPSMIWVTRSADPAKFSEIVVPGCSASKASARSVNVAVSEAAAKTVMLPLPAAADEAGAVPAGAAHPLRPAPRMPIAASSANGWTGRATLRPCPPGSRR